MQLLDDGRKKVNQLHRVISNRNINLSVHRLLLLSVIRPSIKYGSEVWEGNTSQVGCRSLGVLLRPALRQLEVNEPTSLSILHLPFLKKKHLFLCSVYYRQQFYRCLEVIIESVDSISRDERDVPLTQYITNA